MRCGDQYHPPNYREHPKQDKKEPFHAETVSGRKIADPDFGTAFTAVQAAVFSATRFLARERRRNVCLQIHAMSAMGRGCVKTN
jgi:hypothetical protein